LEEVNNLQYLSDNLIKLAQTHKPNGVRFEKASLLKISEAAIRKVQKLAQKKSIKINRQIDDINIVADPQSLTELLVIFLDNAIKYSPENSEIDLSAKKLGRNIVIGIKDHGIGIDENDMPLLF
jgi:signal transduction histidine kinase